MTDLDVTARAAKPSSRALALATLVLGILIGWLVLPVNSGRGLTVDVLRGKVVTVNHDASAIAFDPRGIGEAGKAYSLAGAWFYDADNWSEWHQQTCLKPLTRGQEIEMAVVHPRDSPQADHVLWVKCLSG